MLTPLFYLLPFVYNHNYDFFQHELHGDKILVRGLIWARDPGNLAPGWGRKDLAEVPSSKSLHAFSMEGVAPSSAAVEKIT